LNLLAAYVYFYNPLRMLAALVRPKSTIPRADLAPGPPASHNRNMSRGKRLRRRLRRKLVAYLGDAGVQLFGMWGVAYYTAPGMLRWSLRLARGKIDRLRAAPASTIPMRSPDGSSASHALPGTPLSIAPLEPTAPPVEEKAA
jgi:hypothetical protein